VLGNTSHSPCSQKVNQKFANKIPSNLAHSISNQWRLGHNNNNNNNNLISTTAPWSKFQSKWRAVAEGHVTASQMLINQRSFWLG